MNKPLSFDHAALSVTSIPNAVEWYKLELDATVRYQDDTWAMLDVCGTSVALTVPSQHPPHLAFAVSTIDDLGQDFHEHRDGSNYIYKTDPDGNTIELIYWRK